MLRIVVEQERDGRFIADVRDLPGVMAYGQSRKEVTVKVRQLRSPVFFGKPMRGWLLTLRPIIDFRMDTY
jgi:hypothetical protein